MLIVSFVSLFAYSRFQSGKQRTHLTTYLNLCGLNLISDSRCMNKQGVNGGRYEAF